MKTVQSFFPTTTKSKASFKKDNTYKLMKKVQDKDADLQIQQKVPKSKFSQVIRNFTPNNQNIFRDRNNTVKNYSLDENVQRPIGGMDLYKKMQRINQMSMEESTRRLSRKGSRKNIKQSRQKLASNQNKNNHPVSLFQKDKIQEEFKQQTFKQHTDCKEKYTIHNGIKIYGSRSVGKHEYSPTHFNQNSRKCSTSHNKYGRKDQKYRFKENSSIQSAKSASVQSLCNNRQQNNNQLRWASQQQHNFLDKMAILNEINYNKPLIQKLGSKYFECLLRNRYLDEPQFNHKSPFIYQIKDKLSQTKFISKIKSKILINERYEIKFQFDIKKQDRGEGKEQVYKRAIIKNVSKIGEKTMGGLELVEFLIMNFFLQYGLFPNYKEILDGVKSLNSKICTQRQINLMKGTFQQILILPNFSNFVTFK